VLYVLSFGPACWISSRLDVGGKLVSVIYRPLTWIMIDDDDSTTVSCHVVGAVSQFGADPRWGWHAFARENADGTCDTKPNGAPYITPWQWGPVR